MPKAKQRCSLCGLYNATSRMNEHRYVSGKLKRNAIVVTFAVTTCNRCKEAAMQGAMGGLGARLRRSDL